MIKEPSSLRDPGGFLFYEKGTLYRAINNSYKQNYNHLISSKLFEELVNKKYLVNHSEIELSIDFECYKIIKPDFINFISYPYEWSFSQLKDAALLTLNIQLISIKHGMTLKDATPFNIQFIQNNPVFIDTLSFERQLDDDFSWSPLKQFSEMFLGPLILMSYKNIDANLELKNKINGIPLNSIAKQLSFRNKLNPFVFFNLIIPNLISKKKSSNSTTKKFLISKKQHTNIIRSYINFIENLNIKKQITEWGNYNDETKREKNDYVENKQKVLLEFIKNKEIQTVWDIGSNDGHFTRLISRELKNTKSIFSLDIDPVCVEKNYLYNKTHKLNISPLLFDIANPSPNIGWMNSERKGIFDRLPKPNLIIGLALIHHIINLNIKLDNIVEFFCQTNNFAIIEFVPISDTKSKEIFKSRLNSIEYPSEESFKSKIENYFKILKIKKIKPTDRTLYLLQKK